MNVCDLEEEKRERSLDNNSYVEEYECLGGDGCLSKDISVKEDSYEGYSGMRKDERDESLNNERDGKAWWLEMKY
ncbi:hypothetical protein Tco_0684511 [Tanacetum coccineum]